MAFTLAEVLITLAIIGVVAALTLPTLVTNHKKKVLTTRIQKFYSVLNQAVNMKIAQDGDIDSSMTVDRINDPDGALEFFNVNYGPYMKTIAVEKMTKGTIVGFPDGSGMYIRTTPNTYTYLTFCVNYGKCKKELNESNNTYMYFDGKNTFSFYSNGGVERAGWNGNRQMALDRCAGIGHFTYVSWCAFLLQLDGWEVKDDYPVKL